MSLAVVYILVISTYPQREKLCSPETSPVSASMSITKLPLRTKAHETVGDI
jgi:hypothetical protein